MAGHAPSAAARYSFRWDATTRASVDVRALALEFTSAGGSGELEARIGDKRGWTWRGDKARKKIDPNAVSLNSRWNEFLPL